MQNYKADICVGLEETNELQNKSYVVTISGNFGTVDINQMCEKLEIYEYVILVLSEVRKIYFTHREDAVKFFKSFS